MTAFQFFNFVDEESIAADGVVEFFKDLQDDLFSGFAEIIIDGGCFYAVFVQGRVATLYNSQPKIERIDAHRWLDHLTEIRSDVTFRSINFTVRDLRIIKVLLESGDESMVKNVSAKKVIEKLARVNTSSVIYLETDKQSLLCSMSGNKFRPPIGLLLTPDQIEEIDIDELLDLVPASANTLRVITIDPKEPSSAWVEQQAHDVFIYVTKKLIERYGSMRERVYLNKIIRSINFKADANDRLIFVNARDITDQEVFNSPIQAASVYSELMKLVIDPIKTDLSEQVYGNVRAEIRDELTAFQQKILDQLVGE